MVVGLFVVFYKQILKYVSLSLVSFNDGILVCD